MKNYRVFWQKRQGTIAAVSMYLKSTLFFVKKKIFPAGLGCFLAEKMVYCSILKKTEPQQNVPERKGIG